jgi:hypothetical protein
VEVIMRAPPIAWLLFLLRDGRNVVDSELASFAGGGWQEQSFARADRQRRRRSLSTSAAKTEFVRGDVRDGAPSGQHPGARGDRLPDPHRPHPRPNRDEARMYDVDVNGTVAVLRAAWEASAIGTGLSGNAP